MKKFFTLLCSFAVLFSLTACGSKVNDDAIDAFEGAIINLSKMESADFTIGFEQVTKDLSANMTIDGTYINKDSNPQFSASLDTEMDGEVQKDYIQIYLTDHVMYMNLMNMLKQKQPLPIAAVTKNSTPKKGSLKKSGIKDYLKEATLKDNKITLVFDGGKTKKEFTKLASSDTTGALSILNSIDFNELKIEMNVKKEIMQQAKFTMDMKTNVDGASLSGKFIFDIAFKNMNKANDIVFPDFTEYVQSTQTSPLLGM